ncbi:hypothetical protein [Brevibacillus choshinensis]|uniref:Uncharacterized protein n=1 Tax=Brevibacillus choshinensis TaxID=54911 RepID=A0ABX7FH40_BRECH|nr:hypothetical protein [Brevibacillus choshinensis]QRG65078.1 hypothetical protein JNE38_15580 [Brevibacillus choshinensis]
MRWGAIVGISLVAFLMTWYEWPVLRASHWKTKAAYTTILFASWFIAILLVHNPALPGATQVLLRIYKPFSSLLKFDAYSGEQE